MRGGRASDLPGTTGVAMPGAYARICAKIERVDRGCGTTVARITAQCAAVVQQHGLLVREVERGLGVGQGRRAEVV